MELKRNLPTQNICDFYLVVYRDKNTNEIARIEDYHYDIFGGYGNSTTDIESYKYGYNATIYNPYDLLNGLLVEKRSNKVDNA